MVTLRDIIWESAAFGFVNGGYAEIEINPAHVVRVSEIRKENATYSQIVPCYHVITTVGTFKFFALAEVAKADREKLIAAVDAHNEGVANVP